MSLVIKFRQSPLKIDAAISKKSIDFIITNPSLYVELEFKFSFMQIATLLGSYDNNFSMAKFGGVIFTLSENNFTKTIADIECKKWGQAALNSIYA